MTAATDIGFIEMRISKVVGLAPAGDEAYEYVVLDEVSGDRHLLIQIGHAEAFSLAASLNGMQWGRPMTYQFMAALLHSIGGRVRQVRLDCSRSWKIPSLDHRNSPVDHRGGWG
jgi:bifunctional DNase/RNase